MGRALPNVEVKIVDPETGQEVERGKQGELCARGFIVMKGYYKLPEATAKAIDQVGLVLATGGPAMVKAAYSSGTPAIGVGPGNAPVLISADADLSHAARSAVLSKSFDNGLICGAENNLVVEASVRERLIVELEQAGAAVLTAEETERFLHAAVDPQTRRFQPRIIGQDVATLAELARIQRREPIQLRIAYYRPDRAGLEAFDTDAHQPHLAIYKEADYDS